MSALIEFLGYLIVDIFVLSTGGFILWCFGGFKRPLKTYLYPNDSKSYLVGIIFWIGLAASLALYFYFTK
jgi:hypothetical protein